MDETFWLKGGKLKIVVLIMLSSQKVDRPLSCM